MSGFIVKATPRTGAQPEFYTGRAGADWLSPAVSRAFVYSSKEEAARKAAMFQKLHAFAAFEAMEALTK